MSTLHRNKILNTRDRKIRSQHEDVEGHHYSTSTARLKDDDDAAYTVTASEAFSSVRPPQANSDEGISMDSIRMQKDVDVLSIA